MWQGVMKAWHTIQSAIEQQDPNTWLEILRQPILGNRFLPNEVGTQWGTEPRSNMKLWMEKHIKSLKDIAKEDGTAWKPFDEQPALRRRTAAPNLYNIFLFCIPWAPQPAPIHTLGQWIAHKEEDGSLQTIYHITRIEPLEATKYCKIPS